MKTTVHIPFNYSRPIVLTLISFLFFWCISNAQTTRYVATTGSDANSGAIGSPYLTILKAIGVAVNGDTIRVAAGNYTAAATTTVSKSLAIIGVTGTILNRGSYATSGITGFTITANNVTIKKIKVTNYNVGISNTKVVSNLTLDSVQLFENWGSGFYSTFGIDSLAITNSNLSYNGKSPSNATTLKRGIYLSTGATYSKIRFDQDTVDYNGLAGIEISSFNTTTSIDGVTITNNLVRNNGDAQISTWLGTSNLTKKGILISSNTIVLSDTARYGIEIRNPAGNGQSSGTGSVVISNNNISVVSHTGNSRDMAAIAIVRRKEGSTQAAMNDQPSGVVVSGNTISDFQNPKAGEAYGIVFGGIGHKAFGNTISNTEFPIQLQKGNVNYALNASSFDVAGQANNFYFDRDNSNDACVEIGTNTITTSGVSRLTTGAAATSLTLRANTVTNTSIGETFCTIQQAINFPATLAGNIITASPGTYNEAVTVSKSVSITGAGTTSADVVLNATATPYSATAGNGFAVSANNVTIKKIKVTNYNVGVTSTVATSNLTLDSVELVENFGAGFYSTFSLNNLAITNSILSYNGNKTGYTSNSALKRGIYLLNGPTYSKIYFDNNSVENNDSTGIEISSVTATTSIDSVIITNNIVRYNKEAQISAWLGTSNALKKAVSISSNTIVLSDTSRYGIEVRNPSGNGATSGAGSVVISNNNISVVSHTGNSRDMAAIAVIRRKEGAAATVNDQPIGVVVSGNTISDFQNLKAGDAYGIVLGGTGHKVFGNTISNSEFSIQLQKGNANYTVNTSAPDVVNQPNNALFDRDNSKDACAEVGSNTITGSGAAQLTTAAATSSSTLPAKTITNSTTGETFCSLQQAIDFPTTVSGNTITAAAGTYDEQVIISKGLTIDGIDSSNRIATFSGTPPAVGVRSIFTITAPNVTIKNFKFIVDLSKIYSAIITSGDASNLLITGNYIVSKSSTGGQYGGYGYRNAININVQRTNNLPATDYGTTVGTITNVIVQSNTIDSTSTAKFRGGVASDATSGLLVGGNNVSDGNNFLSSVNHDVIIRNYFGNEIVRNNIFKGGGVEVSVSSGIGNVTVSDNIFDGSYAHTINTAMVRVFTNATPTRVIKFSKNQFINQKWAISFENTRNVILDSNDITAAYDNFRLISINTKLRQSSVPATLETIDIKLTSNNLSAISGLTTGNALEFLNFDQRAPNNYVGGNYIIGELGNENIFNANIPTFVSVSNLSGYNTLLQPFLDLYPEYGGTQVGSTTGFWTRDIFARYNKFYVNGQLKRATSFSTDDYNKVYSQIFDRQDDVNVGAVVLMPTWSGAKNTDWADSANWSYRFSPAAGLDAVIYPQVNQPELFADAACDTIILSNNMTVKTGIHSLIVFGNIRSNGTMDATIGSITLGGTTPQVLSGLMFVKNLTLNNATGAIIAAGAGNKVTLRGIYKPMQGVLTTNDNLVLKSDTSGTASISSGTDNYIAGKVTVERYIPALRAWRLIAAPVTVAGSQTIREAWQEGVNNTTLNYSGNINPAPGYGTHITLGNSSAWGFDVGINNNPSIKGFNVAAAKWDILSSTNISLTAYPAYMLFVRGDRSVNLSQGTSAIATNTVLRSTGNVRMGDQNYTVAATGFTVMGNPYASPINFSQVAKSNSTNIQDNFWVWDPKITGSNGVGGGVNISWDGAGSYDITPAGVSPVSQYLQSGSAFLAKSYDGVTNGTLVIKESDKINAGSDNVYRPQNVTGVAKLVTSLYSINADATISIVDGVLNSYGNMYSNAVDEMDAVKLPNLAESFSTLRDNKLLTVERRQPVIFADTVYYNMIQMKQKSYNFEFGANGFDNTSLNAFLEDNYLHTSTPVNLSGTTTINFTVTGIAASFAANRFRVVFKPLSTLAVILNSIKASKQGDDIMVEWKVENEPGLKHYEVERSVDGAAFTRFATVSVNTNNHGRYDWLDANAQENNNYYRIKMVSVNGDINYSPVVNVNMGKGKEQIVVNTKLIINGTIGFRMINMPGGRYGVSLVNSIGQVIYAKDVAHTAGNSAEAIELNQRLPKGIYVLKFTCPGNKKITEKVIAE